MRLILEYDGTDFRGWAAQPGQRTVAGELARALRVLLRTDVPLVAAGRTDAGVHARGQVVSAPGDAPQLRSLNALLPHDLTVVAAEAASAAFDARRDARSRTYEYSVLARAAPSPFLRRYALWWRHPVDAAALHACAAALVGEHDFTAFTPRDTYHVRFSRRVLDASWTIAGDLLRFRIEADAFMRSMNRVLVGTMLEVASGRRSVDSFTSLLRGRPRSAAGATAPAHGLCLVSVAY